MLHFLSQTSGRVVRLGFRNSGPGSGEDFQHSSPDWTRQRLDVLLTQALGRDQVQDLRKIIKLHNTVKLGLKELIGIGQIFTLWPGFLISRKVKALNEYDQTNRLLLFVCYHQKSILTEFVVIKLLIILFSDSNFCASNLTIFFLLT